MKIFYTASTGRHIRDFHLEILNRLAVDGHEVTVACRSAEGLPCTPVELSYDKNVFSLGNVKAWLNLFRCFKRERFDVVLTHTALAGFLTRSALAVAGKKSTICVHTAHGYLFGKNTLLPGKLTYLLERMCASVTDAILTMNSEDTQYARNLVRRGGKVIQIPGMGVDVSRFRPARDKEKLRRRLGLTGEPLLFYAAEFSTRKNHKILLSAMRNIVPRHPRVRLLLAGDGKRLPQARRYVQRHGLADNVVFLGYVSDTAPVLRACDGAVSVSLSEGLPLHMQEALACGLPVAASRIKGHTDLLTDGYAHLFDARDSANVERHLLDFISELQNNRAKLISRKVTARQQAAKNFVETVIDMIGEFCNNPSKHD